MQRYRCRLPSLRGSGTVRACKRRERRLTKSLQILNTYQVQPDLFVFHLIFCVICFFGFFNLTNYFLGYRREIRSLILGIIFLLGGGLIIFTMFNYEKSATKTRYEAIIDTYSIQDLYDNYKIIERRGEIWVLEELED